MRAVDPSVQLIACGSSGPGQWTFLEWDREVLEERYSQWTASASTATTSTRRPVKSGAIPFRISGVEPGDGRADCPGRRRLRVCSQAHGLQQAPIALVRRKECLIPRRGGNGQRQVGVTSEDGGKVCEQDRVIFIDEIEIRIHACVIHRRTLLAGLRFRSLRCADGDWQSFYAVRHGL